jgi:cell pole-organizing protein PopZ
MAPAPGQNATVEEILASIRQAISEDDAKRTNERVRYDQRATAEKKPVASVTTVIPERKEESEIEDIIGSDAPADAVSAETLADQQFIEHAIEQALDGVRAELESARPLPRPTVNMKASTVEVAVAGGGVQRAVPRARITGLRREVPPPPPRRALMSPKAESSVSGSFDELAKAMMGGNSGKLDEVVEELLRPMLKQWLEGNLPQMVERLVREEIERVARGAGS